MNEHLETVQLLLERGANPACKFTSNGKLLLWAAQTGNAAITGLLAANPGTDLNATDDKGLTGLWLAIQNQHLEITKILLDHGAYWEVRDADGQTPLLWAAKNGHEALAKLLLQKGADIHDQDKQKRTAFFWAVENSHEGIVKLLLDSIGDDPGKNQLQLLNFIASRPVRTRADDTLDLNLGENGDSEDKTPLLSAVRKSFELLAQRYMERDTTVDREDLLRRATSMWCTMYGQQVLLELLLGKSKDDLKKLNQSLLEAAKEGNALLATLSVEEGADIHTRTLYGETPLWWAARNGHAALVEFLYDRGGYIDSKDKFGLTPLAWAVENQHWPVVKLLVSWGADIRASDKSGQTPLSRANSQGMQSAVLQK
jgi:ankyrin repeat protein